MNQSLRVLLACALGAFVGSLVALQIAHDFWWVGLLTGFATGYLALDFKTVIAASGKAFKSAAHEVFAWRPDRQVWKARFQIFYRGLFLLATVAVSTLLYFRINLIHHARDQINKVHPNLGFVMDFVFLAIPFLMGFFTCVATFAERTEELKKANKGDLYVFSEFAAHWFTSPGLIFGSLYLVLYQLPRLCILFFKNYGGKIKNFLTAFAKKFFFLIHSELRLLCGFDAALGALIGYLFGSALVGTIAGGVIGFFNFEIISIRVLKCVPATRSIFN